MKRPTAFEKKLNEFVPLPQEVSDKVMSYTKVKTFSRKELLLEPGQVCDYVYFVEKGLARTYYVKNGKEFTTDIYIDDEFLGEFLSYFSRAPSQQYLELIEDSELSYIHFEDLQKLYDEFPIMERVGRLVAEYHYVLLSEHTYRLKFGSTRERYEELFNRKVEVIRRAPIGVIASYLGMSIENLSRIRRKIQ